MAQKRTSKSPARRPSRATSVAHRSRASRETCPATGGVHEGKPTGLVHGRFGRFSAKFKCVDCGRVGIAVIDPSKDIDW